ncbi:hypothetical protein ABBQ32_005024 [Trebouxia sp. C0010 RCD-2024]
MSGYSGGQQFPGPPRPAGFGVPGGRPSFQQSQQQQHQQQQQQGSFVPQGPPGPAGQASASPAAYLLCDQGNKATCGAGFGRSGSGNVYGQPAPAGSRPNSAGPGGGAGGQATPSPPGFAAPLPVRTSSVGTPGSAFRPPSPIAGLPPPTANGIPAARPPGPRTPAFGVRPPGAPGMGPPLLRPPQMGGAPPSGGFQPSQQPPGPGFAPQQQTLGRPGFTPPGAAVPSFGPSRAPSSRNSSFGSEASGPGPGPFYPSPAPPAPGGARPMARAPAFGAAQQGGFSQPGGPGPQLAPNYGTPQNQPVLDQFEALTLGPAAPGQSGDAGIDLASFPRPTGDAAEAAVAPPTPLFPANAHPRYLRLTCNAIPAQQAVRARFQLPLGAIAHPFAEPPADSPLPVVQLENYGIIRCRRCRTYINPFMQWSDDGRRFQCNLCGMVSECPPEYFCGTDGQGKRLDSLQRPELSQGSVEFIAPQEYMVRSPMPPTYIFLIDVSYRAVGLGILPTIAEAIKSSLDHLPGGERTHVGFITFDSSLHFYKMSPGASAPQMMVVAETDEPFVPVPDELIVNLKESREAVEALLDNLANTFAATASPDSAMGPALQAAYLMMEALGGKLLLFQTSVPNVGVGKITQRDNPTLYNTDSEHRLRVPEDIFFKKFAAEASKAQISIDVFSFSQQFTDLASLSALAKYTTGGVYCYPGFNQARDAPKLQTEIKHNLTRQTGWEGVMRVRCSKGLSISQFHGHFFVRSIDLLSLPQVDPDKAFAVQIKHEESVLTGSVAYMQCAVLFSSSNGERRIRVHTLAMPVVQDLADMYKAVDGAATINLLAKLAVEKSYHAKLDDTRSSLAHKLNLTMQEYRSMHKQNTRGQLPHNQLLYPESLRYLALWVLGLLKSSALRGGARDVPPDERILAGFEIMAAPTPELLRYLYPNLYLISDPTGDWGRPTANSRVGRPPCIPLTTMVMRDNSAYLLDNGRILVLWLGHLIPPSFMQQVFEIDKAPTQDGALTVEPVRKGRELSERINALITDLRRGRAVYPQCFVVRQGSAAEQHMHALLVEDKLAQTQSYVDWMTQLHKTVMAKA